MSETSTRDPELTRARILDAAFELFVEKGFAAVSVREIAERSDVTKSLIHHHFGGKEGLWEATKELAFSQYFQGQKEELDLAETPGPELLINGVIRYFHFLKDNPGVVRLFAWTHLEGDTSCAHLDGELVRLGANRVREAQQAGLLRPDVNPTHVVTIFVSLCTQWFEARDHHAQWPGMGDDEAFLDDFLKIFMEGLLPRPPAPNA
ncbi:MAG: TetR/AcrR family transcriptional regulator [Wenzhouxiangellaceae bacterium]|nr:MAG: TetR/AcrR family transcriptional regulator [Wenzhouxiangellaceae bacterium]